MKTLEEIYHYFEDNFLTNPLNFLTTQEGIASAVPSSNQDGLFRFVMLKPAFYLEGKYIAWGVFQEGEFRISSCFSCPARCKKKW